VATPIGNLGDLTLRAITVLELVDRVAAEDTRVAGQLLGHLGLHKPLLACDANREDQAAAQVIEHLQRGERVAFVSDAGTPAVSDPGARLVAAVRQAGLRIVAIPGVSSITAAISVSGMVEGPFAFVGFAPHKGADRGRFFEQLSVASLAQVLLESPHRIADCCTQLAKHLGPRPVLVARELTKQFEQLAAVPADQLPAWLASDPNHARGEFVLVIAPPPDQTTPAAHPNHDRLLRGLLEHMPLKSAVKLAVDLTGEPRNALYQRALALRGDGESDGEDAGNEAS
jgi:16S rRNA (cytidine1402-2'-O)-methyltransferase